MAKTEEKTDWRESRKRRLLITSATQHETYELCARKWWLENVRKLDVPATHSNVFGTCTHSVGDRYFSADELGRDENGQAVNLYPPDWNVARSRFDPTEIEGVIGPEDQAQIQRLVQQAIEKGYWVRRPGQEVEADFLETVARFHCPSCQGDGNVNGVTCETCDGDGKGTHVQIKGFIDLVETGSVFDHKTTKNMRYAKSKEALAKSTQMLIYAMVSLLKWQREGRSIPTHIVNNQPLHNAVRLVHNVFCKDPNDERVKQVEAFVTVADVQAAWDRIKTNAAWMDFYRRTCERWFDLPNPTSRSACNAYGGCAFQRICCGQEDELGYEKRLAFWRAEGYSVQTPLTVNGSHTPVSQPGSTQMTTFEAALAAKRPQGVPGAVAQPVPGTINPPMMQAPAQPMQTAPAQLAQSAGYAAPVGQAAPVGYPGGIPAGNPVGFVAAQTAPAQPQQPPMQPVQQAPVQPPAAINTSLPLQAPPWAVPNEQACGGSGFNSMGKPCGVCDMHARSTNQRDSSTFTITQVAPDMVEIRDPHSTWAINSRLPAQQAAQPQQAPAQAMQPAPQHVTPPGVPQGAYAAPAPQTPPPEGGQSEGGEDEGKKGGPGRKEQGYHLMVNGSMVRGVEKRGRLRSIDLHQMFVAACNAVAAANTPPGGQPVSFYDLDPFKRKDALSKIAQQQAAACENIMVSAPFVGNGQTDYRAYFDPWYAAAGSVAVFSPIA